MRPFIHFARFSRRWYVDCGRRDFRCYPGTRWKGYLSLTEAYAAAVAAKISEPA